MSQRSVYEDMEDVLKTCNIKYLEFGNLPNRESGSESLFALTGDIFRMKSLFNMWNVN